MFGSTVKMKNNYLTGIRSFRIWRTLVPLDWSFGRSLCFVCLLSLHWVSVALCGSAVVVHGLSCPEVYGIFQAGIKPESPVLAGGLLITGLRGTCVAGF